MKPDVDRIRVVIVHDNPADRECIRSLLAQHQDVDIVAECSSDAEALSFICDEGPDVVFLDIQTPNVDGVQLVEAMERARSEFSSRKMWKPAFIVIASSNDQAVKAFEIHALDFLLKPLDQARFERTLVRVRRHVRQSRVNVNARLLAVLDDLQSEAGRRYQPKRLIVKVNDRVFFLRPEEIDWIEAAGNHVRIHASGSAHLLRESMKQAERRLDPETFVRIHRSAIVNLDRIKELTPRYRGDFVVTMHDGTRLSASRVYSIRLKAFLDADGLGGR